MFNGHNFLARARASPAQNVSGTGPLVAHTAEIQQNWHSKVLEVVSNCVEFFSRSSREPCNFADWSPKREGALGQRNEKTSCIQELRGLGWFLSWDHGKILKPSKGYTFCRSNPQVSLEAIDISNRKIQHYFCTYETFTIFFQSVIINSPLQYHIPHWLFMVLFTVPAQEEL